MKENAEKVVKLGLKRDARAVFDEVESITAAMLRGGWQLRESCIEESLGNIHLIFEREIEAREC